MLGKVLSSQVLKSKVLRSKVLRSKVRSLLGIFLLSSGLTMIIPRSVQAQVVPDDTLGEEQSRVTTETIGGLTSEFIFGGATRDSNLFHSFREFDVQTGRGAYFFNPIGVDNIFSRVTEDSPSNILGRLGVLGTANLFFMNPNGIVFGPEANLDIVGSFAGTTANGIGFGSAGLFTATDPQVPSQRLTVDPAIFLFNQINPNAVITNQSVFVDPRNPPFINGLRVNDGQSLLLLGREIQLPQSKLIASRGRIELAAVEGTGEVGITNDGNRLGLNLPADLRLGNITATQSALEASGIRNVATPGGDIQLYGEQITLTNSLISSNNFSAQNNGAISLQGTQINLDNTNIVANTNDSGRGGDISAIADVIDIRNGNGMLTGSLFAQGSAGDINLVARDTLSLSNQANVGSLSVSQSAAENSNTSDGSSGNVVIETENLNINNAGILTSAFLSRSEGGSLTIRATESVNLNNGTLGTSSYGARSSGAIDLTTHDLTIENSGLNSVATSAIDPAQFSESIERDPNVYPADLRNFLESLLMDVEPGSFGQGDSGTITIDATGTIKLSGGSAINTSTTGRGDGGNIVVTADRIELIGRNENRENSSGIASEAAIGSTGDGGDITVSTRILDIQAGATISANTFSSGGGGNLSIEVTEQATLSGGEIGLQNQFVPSSLTASTTGSGTAGSLLFDGDRLALSGGAVIAASTFAGGAAGDVVVSADTIEIVGSDSNRQFVTSIGSEPSVGSTGDGGNVTVSTRLLDIREGATISASTFGSGRSGRLQVAVTGRANLIGTLIGPQGRVTASGLFAATLGSGKGGSLQFDGNYLRIQEGAAISAATFGSDQAGSVVVNADTIEVIGLDSTGRFTSGIVSESSSVSSGNGGDVSVTSRIISVREGAVISARSLGLGNAGALEIVATEEIELRDRAQIATSSQQEDALAGDISIDAGNLFYSIDSDVTTSAANASGGNIQLTADDIRLRGDSDIRTDSAQDGGNITLTADTIIALEDSDIFAAAARGRGGNITLETAGFFGNLSPLTASDVSIQEEVDTPLASDERFDTQLDNNGQVDLNATGQVSSGVISTPDSSFIQNDLTELSDSLINREQVVASSCIARIEQGSGQRSSFVITRAEGLPQTPQSSTSAYDTGAVRLPTAAIADTPTWQRGDRIIEPQSAYELADGRLVLSQDCTQ